MKRAIGLGNKRRSDAELALYLLRRTFGYGTVEQIEGNKLEIVFELGGRKQVMERLLGRRPKFFGELPST